ncbi:MAG: hypothetical protein RLY87_659 [Chloroflexota bacterium]|jgi:uncharacterized NAD(P)/FAD-binding protein YdhS
MQTVVIGGGASGVLAVLALLRVATADDVVTLVEPGSLGEGIAYATQNEQLLLNVRASNMSSTADEPGHFVTWLAKTHPGTDGDAFVPRSWYARYLRDALTEAIAASAGQYRHVATHVSDVIPNGTGATVVFADSSSIGADQVVLAIGNNQPTNPLARWIPASPRIVSGYDWHRIGTTIQPDDAVAIIGTGLTMVDSVIALLGNGYRGTITAFSRRGYEPRTHVARAAYPSPFTRLDGQRPLSVLLREFRIAVASAAAAGVPWQAVVDSLRPHTQGIWQQFGTVVQRRFLRHLRPYWDVHRHRIAPEIAAQLDEARQRGQLRIITGRMTAAQLIPQGISIMLSTKAGPIACDAAWVINCTGPSTDFGALDAPLITTLRNRGLLNPDALRLGIANGVDARLLDRTGQTIPWLWTIGPLRKGLLWECIAIPDIRSEAKLLAADISAASAHARMGGV